MPAVKSEMLKHLNGALDLENKGFDMYKRFAEKAKNELAKFLFSKLRDEEIVHAKMIDELISKVKSGQISEIGTNTIMDVTKDFTPISSEDIF